MSMLWSEEDNAEYDELQAARRTVGIAADQYRKVTAQHKTNMWMASIIAIMWAATIFMFPVTPNTPSWVTAIWVGSISYGVYAYVMMVRGMCHYRDTEYTREVVRWWRALQMQEQCGTKTAARYLNQTEIHQPTD